MLSLVTSQSVTSDPNHPVCPGETISYTCTTTGSPIIAWRSEEYIEPGGTQVEFAGVNNIGDTDRSLHYPSTVATLTDNRAGSDGNLVLVSTLTITTVSSPQPASVTCIHIGQGTRNTITVQVIGNC